MGQWQESYVSDRPMQLARREWQRQMSRPPVWWSLAAISAILALIGPFETSDTLNLPTSFAYWFVIAAGGYMIGVAVNAYADARLAARAVTPLHIVLRGAVIGLGVCVLVFAVNTAAFPGQSEHVRSPALFATIVAIAIIVTWLLHALHNGTHANAEAASLPARSPAVLERIDLDKRGALIAMSVEDHYVRIITTKGEQLVLLRLSDAVREVAPVDGAQVHRSHWVAFGHVVRVRGQSLG